VVLINVSVAAAVEPLPAVLLIPVTAALVQANVVPEVALVAVYVAETFVQRLDVRALLRTALGLMVTVTFSGLPEHEFAVVV